MRRLTIATLLLWLAITSNTRAEDPFLLGGDISALSDLEKAGAVYRDNGARGDAIEILHRHGCNLFRLRLFVNPNHDATRDFGPTQDLPMVLALAKRIKASGAKFSLAIHYSDTWADPSHQFKPAAWEDLPLDRLKAKVTEYTTSVMQAMQSNGTPPDIVEVGNETTNGMLWPTGKLNGKTSAEKQTQWDNYAALEEAGTVAVRAQLPSARIMIHINSGGKEGVPPWFFSKLNACKPDFDIIGLSFYPTWDDSIDGLKKNLRELAPLGKDILIIEAAYPYKTKKRTPQMQWPMTPLGQKQFLDDLITTVKATPDHRGIGVCWWYPEALPIKDHNTWEGGGLALFDENGKLLPALAER